MQVDLNTSSIRPGKSQAWLDALRQNILGSVQVAAGHGVMIVAHTGSWEHDVVQARFRPGGLVLQVQHSLQAQLQIYGDLSCQDRRLWSDAIPNSLTIHVHVKEQ